MMVSRTRKFLLLAVGLLVLGAPFSLRAQMTSTSFKIIGDSISQGGGRGTSASLILEDSVGEPVVGEGFTSSSFKMCAGYECIRISAAETSITFSVTPNLISLGTLNTGSVATGNTTIITSTTSSSGYITTVLGDGQLRTTGGGSTIGDVSDGTVSAGSSEYGIGLTGSDRAFVDDRSVTTSLRTVASNAGAVTNSAVTVTFKAAISTTVPPGSYSQIATFISTSTF